MLIVDDRENPVVLEKIKERMKDECAIKRLNSADYIIGNIGIEAKEINDLYRSIMGYGRTRTIVNQLVDLEENFEKPMLVVYGSLLKPYIHGGRPTPQRIAQEKTRMQNIINSFKATFYHRFPNILYMELNSMDDFVNFLIKNHTQLNLVGKAKELHTKSLPNKKTLDARISVISSIEGITINHAELLLKKFGSIPKILNSRTTQKSLMEIEGIGRKKAKKILDLRKKWN